MKEKIKGIVSEPKLATAYLKYSQNHLQLTAKLLGGMVICVRHSKRSFCSNPRGILPSECPGEFGGIFLLGILVPWGNRSKKIRQNSTANCTPPNSLKVTAQKLDVQHAGGWFIKSGQWSLQTRVQLLSLKAFPLKIIVGVSR